MKTLIFTFALILSTDFFSHADNFDFRNAKWGMSAQEIIVSEGKSPTEQKEGIITYDKEDVAGQQLDALYFIQDDKLYAAKYFSMYENVYTAKDKFMELDIVLEKKYGKGELDIDMPSYVKSVHELLTSMSNTGRGRLSRKWKTKETVILLELKGNGSDKFSVSIYYDSIKFRHLKEKNRANTLIKKGEKL